MSKWLSRSLLQGPYLRLCTTEAEFHKECKFLKVPKPYPEFVGSTSNARMTSFHNEHGALCCVVCIKPRTDVDPIEVAALLVHEAVHVWQNFREYIGETSPSTEFEAYVLQNLTGTLLQAYADQVVSKGVVRCSR